MSASRGFVVDLVTATCAVRGHTFEETAETRPEHAGWVVGTLKNRMFPHSVTLAINPADIPADKDAIVDAVAARFKNAEATMKNLEWVEERQMHEAALVAAGWRPGPDWKHPLKDAILKAYGGTRP